MSDPDSDAAGTGTNRTGGIDYYATLSTAGDDPKENKGNPWGKSREIT